MEVSVKRFIILISVLTLVILLIGGCSSGKAIPFSMLVIPEEIGDSVPGQRCVFLVTVDGGESEKAVNISAEASGATVTVFNDAISNDEVAEVMVVPDDSSEGSTVTVHIEGERDGLKLVETVTVDVWESLLAIQDIEPHAVELRDKFIPWLADNHPEFGINNQTEWTHAIVRPNILVVMYYLFFSDEWEMGLRWHVMIPPYDCAEIYLRHRTSEVSPSYAFKISSLEGETEPEAVEPEELVWR